MRREFDRHYKSLLHFDFPYFNEPGDGMRDEINYLTWERIGSPVFAGSEIPCEELHSPKFGYRCLHTTSSSSYLRAKNGVSALEINPAKYYTIEMFINAQGAGNIFALYSGVTKKFAIELNSSNAVVISGSEVSQSTSPSTLALNTWKHIRVKIHNYSYEIYTDGTRTCAGTYLGYADYLTEARLGGFSGYIDEFLFSANYSDSNAVPTEPYQGSIDFDSLGGTGDGRHGIANYTNANSNLIINTAARLSVVSSDTTFSYKNIENNTHGGFEIGDEIMLLVNQRDAGTYRDAGFYAFRKIIGIKNRYLTVDSPVTEFEFTSANLAKYNVDILKVPNYQKFTLGENVILKPNKSRSNYAGGIVVFRVQGDCIINGKILTHGMCSYARQDYLQMCNADLPERFLLNVNGGVFIVCGGTFTAGANARIGGGYSGESGPGQGVRGGNGGNGGAGYGGAGGSCPSHQGLGGNGGVGGGGGAADKNEGGAAGTSGTGGFGTGTKNERYSGGTQGKTEGGTSEKRQVSETGGGGAYGNSGNYSASKLGGAGACVLLACNKLNCDMAAVSTGGQGGKAGSNAAGGGGSGLCYIACGEMI